MKIKIVLTVILSSLFTLHCRGQVPNSPNENLPLSLIKNNGQWESFIQYKSNIPGGAVFITQEGFTYNLYSTEDLDRIHDFRLQRKKDVSQEKIQSHAYRLKFSGGSLSGLPIENDKRSYYHNYFIGNDPAKWKSEVPLFGKIIYENIYPDIDLVVYSSSARQFKYDLVLHKGADISRIKMEFEGVAPKINKDGELEMATSLGTVKESFPYTYQNVNGIKQEVKCHYVSVGKNRIGFEIAGEINNELPVIIDPTLIFASYSGSTATTFGFSATYNNLGDLIDGGECFAVGWPATTGAFQTTFGGNVDMGINKFSSNGSSLLSSTYLGGAQREVPISMICDANMDLYILGHCGSSDFPVSTGCYDNTYNGGSSPYSTGDITVTHLNSSLTALIGSSYIGGSDDDGDMLEKGEIYLDNVNNIYVADVSQSTDFPTTGGAFQTTYGGSSGFGGGDGIVFIMNNNCSNLFASTYLGGSDNERLTGIRKLPNGNVAVAGESASSNYPVTSNAYQTTSLSTNAGVLTVLNPNLTGLIGSSYVSCIPAPTPSNGTSLQFVDYDSKSNLYVYGVTETSFPVTPGKYSNTGGMSLVAKFTPNVDTIIWSTRIGSATSGGGWGINPSAFLADNCGKIYLAGFSGIAGYPTTSNALSTTPQGFWLGVLDIDATSLLFGTFFGGSGDHLDGGTSRFDKKGIIYHAVCHGTAGAFPTTTGAAFPNPLGSASWDVVGFKIDNNSPAVVALTSVNPGYTSCSAPFTVTFNNVSQNAISYYWDFGDNTPTTTTTSPTHTFQHPGVYNVMLVADNPATCNLFDTTYVTIQILDTAFALSTNDTTLCKATVPSLLLTAKTVNNTSNVTYHWIPNPAIIGSNIGQSILVNPSIDSVFVVIAIDSIIGQCGISDTDTVHINFIPVPYYALPDTVVHYCPGDVLQFFAFADTNSTYAWQAPSNSTLSASNIANPFATPVGNMQYVVYMYEPGGKCYLPDTIKTFEDPKVQIQIANTWYQCEGDSIQLQAQILNAANYNLDWTDITGGTPVEMISGQNTLTPLVKITQPRKYILNIQSAQLACPGADTIEVLLNPKPVLPADTIVCDSLNGYILMPTNNIPLQNIVAVNWFPSTGLSNPTIINPIVNTTSSVHYTLTITYKSGDGSSTCTLSDEFDLVIDHLEYAGLEPQKATICPYDTIVLKAYGGVKYNWINPDTVSSDQVTSLILRPLRSTEYQVEIVGPLGCKKKFNSDITVHPIINADAGEDEVIKYGESYHLMASGGGSYYWSPSSTLSNAYVADPFATPKSTTLYYVTITSQEGCKAMDSVTISVTNANLPTAFTPNGDGRNDILKLLIPDDLTKLLEFKIFDRWGNEVFQTQNITVGWDGTYKGVPAETGVYFYTLSYSIGQKIYREKGDITLIR